MPIWIFIKPFLGGALRFLRAIPWEVWLGVAALGLALFYGHLRYNAGQRDVQTQYDEYKAKMIAATDAARVAARRAETAQKGAIDAALAEYRRGLDNAKSKGAGVTTGIKSGAVGLRQHWQGCPERVPGTAAGPVGPDAGPELRAESAGRIVGTGATADAQVIALQALISSAPHCFTVN